MSRRDGDGVPQKRKSGRWGARVYDKHSGRQIPLGTFDRKKDAAAKERMVKRELELGSYTEPKHIGFADFIELWLSAVGVTGSTLGDYRNTCGHLTRRFGNRLLNQIRLQDLDLFVAEFSRTHAHNTTQKLRTRIKQLFKQAVRWDYLTTSPAADLTRIPKRHEPTSMRIINSAQTRSFIAAAPDYWRPFFLVAVMTGLRRNELFGLTWSCVQWDEGKIRVRQQLKVGGTLGPLKSHAAYRTVDVGPSVMKALREHRLACPMTADDLVFPTALGTPVNTSSFDRWVMKKTREKAGLPDLTLHDLRHTFASALIDQGQTVKYVQTVMGHASAQTTLDVYGHLFDTSGHGAARGLERWLSETPADGTQLGDAG